MISNILDLAADGRVRPQVTTIPEMEKQFDPTFVTVGFAWNFQGKRYERKYHAPIQYRPLGNERGFLVIEPGKEAGRDNAVVIAPNAKESLRVSNPLPVADWPNSEFTYIEHIGDDHVVMHLWAAKATSNVDIDYSCSASLDTGEVLGLKEAR